MDQTNFNPKKQRKNTYVLSKVESKSRAFESPDKNILFNSGIVGTRSSLSVGVSSIPLIFILIFTYLLLWASQDFRALRVEFM
jgi:hypothetical protein